MSAQPLTDAEFDRLAEVLQRCGGKHAMNMEMLDGFLAALICGPETVLPSEYLPKIWGGDQTNEPTFDTQSVVREFVSLIMRHWNAICHNLQSGDEFLPVLLNDENGIARANDWATGFMRGVDMRRDSWLALMHDDDHGGVLIPIMALAYEHHPDPEMRPYKEPMSIERREQLIVGVAASVPAIYRYFAVERKLEAQKLSSVKTFRRDAPKIGRNEPCPCGSGKKFKHCCANLTLH
jgi:uncharacterized protein